MDATFIQRGHIKVCQSENYRWIFNSESGFFARCGNTKEENPRFSPFGPEILDLEASSVCHGAGGVPCKFCYKSNTSKGENMSLETFEMVLSKLTCNTLQIAIGIGDIDANPDLPKILARTRQAGIVPNITINGYRMTDEYYDLLAKYCGAVAVSHYDDGEACFNAVRELGSRININGNKLRQVNIHKLLAEETVSECFYLLERAESLKGRFEKEVDECSNLPDQAANDPRLENLNAIVFLLLKPKGKRNKFHPVKSKEIYKELISTAQKVGINVGMDSCSGPLVMKTCNEICSVDSIEPCESSCFSLYLSVKAEVFPCSFSDGEKDWKTGIPLYNVTDFIKEVWFSDRLNAWREKLLSSTKNCDCEFKNDCRACPVFDITACKEEK